MESLIDEVVQLRKLTKDLAEVSSQHSEARGELQVLANRMASMRVELDESQSANREAAMKHDAFQQKVYKIVLQLFYNIEFNF